MNYNLVPSSKFASNGILQPPSYRSRTTRQASLISWSTRHIRYFAIIILLLVVCISIPAKSYSNVYKLRLFQIQHVFKEESAAAKLVRTERQQDVRKAFIHAWNGYKEHAWLEDEVMPLSGGSKNPYVGWAATLVDCLDTLLIMGLEDEFHHALNGLESIDFSKPNTDRVPVFETTIRYLGGLLGAYDISEGKYPILLQKAEQLGELLFGAFNTSNGMPVPYYRWEKLDEVLEGESGVLIAQIGNRKYFDGISRITDYLDEAQNSTKIPGLWPSRIETIGPSFKGSAFTLGAWADSLYEYLPKEHILLGGFTDQYLAMYRSALAAATKYHFFRPMTPGNQDILFSGNLVAGKEEPTLLTDVQHLTCFVGGMVGLGARINDSPEEMKTAIKLTEGCVWAYQNTASGIMPEIFGIQRCPVEGSCDWTNENTTEPGYQYGILYLKDKSYQLRPEAIESVFIMYRLTGDPIWQEKGWRMFQAIVKHTTTPIANARLKDVTDSNPPQEDSMESFWLAETLKYFFLLFSEPDLVSLDEFVL